MASWSESQALRLIWKPPKGNKKNCWGLKFTLESANFEVLQVRAWRRRPSGCLLPFFSLAPGWNFWAINSTNSPTSLLAPLSRQTDYFGCQKELPNSPLETASAAADGSKDCLIDRTADSRSSVWGGGIPYMTSKRLFWILWPLLPSVRKMCIYCLSTSLGVFFDILLPAAWTLYMVVPFQTSLIQSLWLRPSSG